MNKFKPPKMQVNILPVFGNKNNKTNMKQIGYCSDLERRIKNNQKYMVEVLLEIGKINKSNHECRSSPKKNQFYKHTKSSFDSVEKERKEVGRRKIVKKIDFSLGGEKGKGGDNKM
ncbi:hypothetical protein Lal_00012102 [Lupinus albus]|nr:hypothetical protein Lal_00012102 [Lupinus albus]